MFDLRTGARSLVRKPKKMNCPVSNAEKRLADAASYWKRAHDSYFDPDEFRRNVQSSIQAFRSITWLLQKAKDSISDFESWYGAKQDAMREDKRLRWLVVARNQIEKQGDLDTKSKFIVEHVNSWLPAEKRVFDLPPSTRPKDTAKIIAATFPDSKCTEGAVLKVSREWIDSELPEEEILSLLVHVYSRLQEVLLEAHQLLEEGVRDGCEFYAAKTKSTGRLPTEMTRLQFPAVCWYSLEHGILKECDHKTKPLTREEVQESVTERYDRFNGIDTRLSPASSFSEICDKFFAMGKHMLQKDGHHAMIALVFTENGFHPWGLQPGDRAEKHIMIRELASNCKRLRATSCILIGEIWVAPFSSKYGPYAANYPNRKEALSLNGFHKDEGYLSRVAIFERDGDTIVFPEGQDLHGEQSEILRPIAEAIKEAWG